MKKKYLIPLLLLPALALGAHKLGAGATTTVSDTLVSQEQSYFQANKKYQEVKPFVGTDGVIYRVDHVVQSNGEGKPSTESFQIVTTTPVIQNVTSTN